MRKEKGITLILLVVTVVIFLILIGITVGKISPDTNFIETMKNYTKEEREKAQNEKDDIKYLENNL